MADLPAEILIDILSRLSIKTIATCRCVSKTWRNLLSSSNSQFTKHHFSRSPVQLIIETSYPQNDFRIVELEDDTDVDNSFKPFPSRFSSHYRLVAVNSCNGFLCLATFYNHSNPIIVCNPITGEYLNLPSCNHTYINSNVVSGFGFSANTNQYKVVRLYRGGEKPDDQTVEVYTIGTESWRTIGTDIEFPDLDELSSATFFNGAIHWFVYDENYFDFIISFNIETEEFDFVPPPPHFNTDTESTTEWYQINIGVLGEFLYLSDNMELWVMMEYGVEESWTKVYVVDRPLYSHQPLKYLRGGKILINYNGIGFFSYDHLKEICKDFKASRFFRKFKTIAHVPSFMSFNDAMMGDKDAELPTSMCQVYELREEIKALYLLTEDT